MGYVIKVSAEKPDQVAQGLTSDQIHPYATPAVDVCETPNEVILLVDVPGVEPDNLTIDLHEHSLAIFGKVMDPTDEGPVFQKEYDAKDYFRRFALSDRVDPRSVRAELSDGVLRVVFRKSDKHRTRSIAITQV